MPKPKMQQFTTRWRPTRRWGMIKYLEQLPHPFSPGRDASSQNKTPNVQMERNRQTKSTELVRQLRLVLPSLNCCAWPKCTDMIRGPPCCSTDWFLPFSLLYFGGQVLRVSLLLLV
jgi:hypothetical protein